MKTISIAKKKNKLIFSVWLLKSVARPYHFILHCYCMLTEHLIEMQRVWIWNLSCFLYICLYSFRHLRALSIFVTFMPAFSSLVCSCVSIFVFIQRLMNIEWITVSASVKCAHISSAANESSPLQCAKWYNIYTHARKKKLRRLSKTAQFNMVIEYSNLETCASIHLSS